LLPLPDVDTWQARVERTRTARARIMDFFIFIFSFFDEKSIANFRIKATLDKRKFTNIISV
jgi:hypothetical protein